MKPLPTGSPAAGEPGGECYSRSPHVSRSCQCFPLATGSQRAREPSRSNPQRSACWGAKQAEKAQSRYRGANKISGTLAVSSFGQAQAPKPGESVLHTRCGPEVSASILQLRKETNSVLFWPSPRQPLCNAFQAQVQGMVESHFFHHLPFPFPILFPSSSAPE